MCAAVLVVVRGCDHLGLGGTHGVTSVVRFAAPEAAALPKIETPMMTTSIHDRLLADRMKDAEFRAEFERASREIMAIDRIVNELDALRATHGLTKAELAREIGKNPASVRRLFTAPANPELRTVVAIADALDADVVILPRSQRRKRPGRLSAAV
jgi:DNA-binding phage protein